MQKKQRRHFELKDIEKFLHFKRFTTNKISEGKKSNFSRRHESFRIEKRQFLHKKGKVDVKEKEQQTNIIHDIHEDNGESWQSKSVISYLGKTFTYEKVKARFFSYSMFNAVAAYLEQCDK